MRPVSLYVDVSGKQHQDRVVTAAAYVASDAQWEHFRRHWRQTLGLNNLAYFHATEFFACKGEFGHLRRGSDEHTKQAALLALAAYTNLAKGYSFSVDLEHFDHALRRSLRKLRTPNDRIKAEMFAVGYLCARVAHTALPPAGPRAEMFIEQGDGVGEILEWLRYLKQINEPWTEAFLSFEQLPGTEYALQAADYLAHETWLEATKFLRNPTRTWNDGLRDTFKLLTTGPSMAAPAAGTSKVDVLYATDRHFRDAAPKFAGFIAANAAYRRKPWHHHWRRRLRQGRRRLTREATSFVRGKSKRVWYGWLRMGRRR